MVRPIGLTSANTVLVPRSKQMTKLDLTKWLDSKEPAFRSRYHVELFSGKLDLLRWFAKGTGDLAQCWSKARKQADRARRQPIVIAKAPRQPVLMFCPPRTVRHLTGYDTGCEADAYGFIGEPIEVWRLDTVLKRECRLVQARP